MNGHPLEKVAVLDIGKTNAKVVVLDCATGAEIAERRTPNRVLSGPPYPHYDIDALKAFVIEALAGFARDPGFDAISITTHGACAALIDREGNLAVPVLDYEHEYPEKIRQAYVAMRPSFAETFSPPLPGGLNLGAQLHYQKTVLPEAFAQTAAIMTYPQYWAWWLSGVAANEPTSLGCHTDLWRPREGSYSSLIDRLGLRSLMAPVRSAFEPLGPVLPQIAERIGLTRQVSVYCGIHDSNASLLPHLVGRDAPFAVVSTGTWAISFAVGGDLDHLDPTRDTLANVDAYGRAVPAARFMGGREFDTLKAELGEFSSGAALDAMPRVIRRGLTLLPNIAPGSGPFPQRKRQWLNDQAAGSAERWAAACLYMALMTETCLELIGAKGPALVEGPFSANPLYLRALRSLLKREVLAVSGSTGTAHGAAMLAANPCKSDQTLASADPLPSDLAAYRRAWRAHAGALQR